MDTQAFAIILAGGSGQRFWPLSRRSAPKQLLALYSEKTLIEATLDRLEGVVPPERILVLTNAEQVEKTRRLLGQRLPSTNIIAEPAKRDTAPAVALGVTWVASQDPNGVMAVLPADHLIKDTDAFQKNLKAAFQTAQQERKLITIGIKPTWACPSYGYIETGAKIPSECGQIRSVLSFREKPSVELAEQFMAQGTYFWNAGMFIWSVPAIHSELAAHAPELAEFVNRHGHPAGLQTSDWAKEFEALPKVSIDYAVMEKASHVLMIESEFDWDDVGGWIAVARYLENDVHQNATNAPLVAKNASGNIIHAQKGKTVALLGVRDLIVVETADALLVASRAEAERIKEIVAALPPTLQ
jgi:mannose-1-phosphate guanylyltransferase